MTTRPHKTEFFGLELPADGEMRTLEIPAEHILRITSINLVPPELQDIQTRDNGGENSKKEKIIPPNHNAKKKKRQLHPTVEAATKLMGLSSSDVSIVDVELQVDDGAKVLLGTLRSTSNNGNDDGKVGGSTSSLSLPVYQISLDAIFNDDYKVEIGCATKQSPPSTTVLPLVHVCGYIVPSLDEIGGCGEEEEDIDDDDDLSDQDDLSDVEDDELLEQEEEEETDEEEEDSELCSEHDYRFGSGYGWSDSSDANGEAEEETEKSSEEEFFIRKKRQGEEEPPARKRRRFEQQEPQSKSQQPSKAQTQQSSNQKSKKQKLDKKNVVVEKMDGKNEKDFKKKGEEKIERAPAATITTQSTTPAPSRSQQTGNNSIFGKTSNINNKGKSNNNNNKKYKKGK